MYFLWTQLKWHWTNDSFIIKSIFNVQLGPFLFCKWSSSYKGTQGIFLFRCFPFHLWHCKYIWEKWWQFKADINCLNHIWPGLCSLYSYCDSKLGWVLAEQVLLLIFWSFPRCLIYVDTFLGKWKRCKRCKSGRLKRRNY